MIGAKLAYILMSDISIIWPCADEDICQGWARWFIKDARMASNDGGIEWQSNTFDAMIDIHMYRILIIFASFESAWYAL